MRDVSTHHVLVTGLGRAGRAGVTTINDRPRTNSLHRLASPPLPCGDVADVGDAAKCDVARSVSRGTHTRKAGDAVAHVHVSIV